LRAKMQEAREVFELKEGQVRVEELQLLRRELVENRISRYLEGARFSELEVVIPKETLIRQLRMETLSEAQLNYIQLANPALKGRSRSEIRAEEIQAALRSMEMFGLLLAEPLERGRPSP